MIETFVELYEVARTLPTLVFIIIILGFIYIAFHVILFAIVTACMPFYGLFICIKDKKYIQIKAEVFRVWNEWKQTSVYDKWLEIFKFTGLFFMFAFLLVIAQQGGFEDMSEKTKNIVTNLVYISCFNFAMCELMTFFKKKEKNNEQS